MYTEERGKTLPECRRTDPGSEEGVGRSEWRICRYGSDPEYGRYGDDLAGADGTYEKGRQGDGYDDEEYDDGYDDEEYDENDDYDEDDEEDNYNRGQTR